MTEMELLEKSKTDEKAVEDLLNLYKPLVSKIARRYSFVVGELDDLIQEGMIGLYQAIKGFDKNKDASFKTFANLCITRKLQSAIRKQNNNKNKVFLELFDIDAFENFDIASDKENPEKTAISRENFDYINQQINEKLSDYEKHILKLYLNGLSYDKIAFECNVSKKSVDNALSRLRSKLFYLLDDIKN